MLSSRSCHAAVFSFQQNDLSLECHNSGESTNDFLWHDISNILAGSDKRGKWRLENTLIAPSSLLTLPETTVAWSREENHDQRVEKSNILKRNKWRGVTISLRTGGQWHPTPIHNPTPTPYTNIHKKYPECPFCQFRLDHYGRTDGPMAQWTNRPTDWQSLL